MDNVVKIIIDKDTEKSVDTDMDVEHGEQLNAEERIIAVANRILDKHMLAFEELAK